MAAKKIIFSGCVQGVGFRYTCYQLAQDFSVTGYVMNLRDGSVEMGVEGSDQEIQDFLHKISTKMSGNITNISDENISTIGATSFEIRR